MAEVSIRILHLALDLARGGGADTDELLDGLTSLARRGGEWPSLFDWSDFVVMWERLEKALGGPEGFAEVARSQLGIAYPESLALTAVYRSPEALFEFLMVRHMRTSFRNVDVKVLEKKPDGWIHFRETILPPHRGCEALHRATRAFCSDIPLNFRLPPAEVAILRMTPQSADFRARFPAMPAAKTTSGAPDLIAAQLDEAFSMIIEATTEGGAGDSPEVTVDVWANKLGLSPRQRDVFTRLLQGRANKEIAAQLECSERNVEFHLGKIFKAAGVTSRAELLVKVLGSASAGTPPSSRGR